MARRKNKTQNKNTNKGNNAKSKQVQNIQKTTSNSNKELIDDIKKQLIQKLISKL